MGIDHLTRHLHELLSMAESHYLKIRSGHEEEAIHQLRVSLKKVNAVFKLMAYVAPQSFKAKVAFGSLKEIYDLSGAVRDLQIAHHVLGQYQNAYNQQIQESFNDEMAQAIGQLLEWKKRKPSGELFVLEGSAAQRLKSINKARWLKGSVGYTDHLYQNIELLLSSKKKDKWHRIRISLKRIRFVIDWALNLKKDIASAEEYKLIRLLGKLLGDWHDRVIAAAKIPSYATESTYTSEKKVEDELLRKIGYDRRSLLAVSRFYLRDLLANR
jgi:CHAD domain-containing protein